MAGVPAIRTSTNPIRTPATQVTAVDFAATALAYARSTSPRRWDRTSRSPSSGSRPILRAGRLSGTSTTW